EGRGEARTAAGESGHRRPKCNRCPLSVPHRSAHHWTGYPHHGGFPLPLPAAAVAGVAARTPYRVTLHQIECCNCNHGCGCQFAGYPDHGSCEFLIGFQIIDGRFGTVSLAGARGVVVCEYPGAIHEGNGKVVLFLDRALEAEQVAAVASILSGQMGGMPWEALAGTVTSFTGPVLESIEMTVSGTHSSYRIP